jgi:hypothetical protein
VILREPTPIICQLSPPCEWIHAALVGASRKYRAILDNQAAPPAPPAGDCVVSVAPRFGGARLTVKFDRELTDRIEELVLANRSTRYEVIALAVYQDKSASRCIAGSDYGNPGHSLTMDLDLAQLASLTARARTSGLSVPEFLRHLLTEAPAPRTFPPSNVIPLFTRHFRPA